MKKYARNKNERQYVPRHSEKYCGTYPIICRSSWEYRLCEWLDHNSKVTEWSSESVRISYIDPTKGKRYGILDEKMGKRRIYYPDFYIKFSNGKKYIVEVKPEKETRLPRKKGGKSNKTMILREETYYRNKAKFESAKKWCEKMGMEFLILTEKQLFRNK